MAGISTGIELQDNFTWVMYRINDSVNLAISYMDEMSEVMNTDIDTSSLREAREEIDQVVNAANELRTAMEEASSTEISPVIVEQPVQMPLQIVPDTAPQQEPLPAVPNTVPQQESLPVAPNTVPQQEPVQWESDRDLLAGAGMNGYQQQIQSTDALLEQLSSTQNEIARQAYNTPVISPDAFKDINSLAVRIDLLRERIQQVENNSLDIGTETASAELANLYSQLSTAVQEQNELNQAMQNMDISAANNAYLRLSSTISNTERYIVDNTAEQSKFNQEIRAGTSSANGLIDSIKGIASVYMGVQGAGKALDLSDEITQTTARLNLMNDGAQSTDELFNMVYAAAENARGSITAMADVVGRFGNNAKDAFGSSEEIVAFAELVQKQMTIAGASTSESANAMLQLSQALGSGVLRGDELNSIFEQAPNLIQNIADYLDKPIGQIREMAANGELSASVVKSAIFDAADEINAQFNAMPKTWNQVWSSMKNSAIMAFRQVLQRINNLASNDGFQEFTSEAVEAMATLANMILTIFELVGDAGNFTVEHWSIISPIVYGVVAALALYATYLGITKAAEVASTAAKIIACAASYAHAAATQTEASATAAATAAQYGFNTALLACPLTWILVLIIAVIAAIYVLIAVINELTGASLSATGVIFGAIMVLGAMLYNSALGILDLVLGIINFLVNPFITFANFLANVFENPISSIIYMFHGLADNVLGVLESIASAIDSIFGSNLSGAVAGFRTNLKAMTDEVVQTYAADENYQQKYDQLDLSAEDLGLDRLAYGDAFSFGYETGEAVDSAISDFSLSDIFGSTDIPNPEDYTSSIDSAGASLDDISKNTGDIKDSLDVTSEDLEYLRDIAERDTINRFTTAEVKVEMGGVINNISEKQDLDGVVEYMTEGVKEAMEKAAEGEHG